MNLEQTWNDAMTFDRFMDQVEKNRPLWEGVYRLARLPEGAADLACKYAADVRLLALVEDWCGDASNSIPPLVRLAEAADCLEMRLLKRDEHLDLMDKFLTNGSRSIPVVIALDPAGEVLGHWGPRPIELQAWVMENKDRLPKAKLYPQTRRWYAADKAASTVNEVLALFLPEERGNQNGH